jgi:hypothetical protein
MVQAGCRLRDSHHEHQIEQELERRRDAMGFVRRSCDHRAMKARASGRNGSDVRRHGHDAADRTRNQTMTLSDGVR